MEKPKSTIKMAWPYQQDKMNLPVHNLVMAIPFYEMVMGFRVVARKDTPYKSVTLDKNGFQMGLAENGGDSSQDGCFFEVDDVEKAFAELKANGLEKELSEFDRQKHGNTEWKVFFVVAPDGLCYCYGERQE